MMMMMIGGGGLTSITLFVRAAALSIFIHGIVTFHLLTHFLRNFDDGAKSQNSKWQKQE